LTSQQKENKVAEGLGMIKESFDEIKSVYGQEKMAPRKGRASMKIPSYAKGKFDHIQSNLAHENISEDSKDHG
jgi:hypothetical protein